MDPACGNCLLAIAQSPSLSGFEGFFEEYVPVFLAGNICVLNQSGRKGQETIRVRLEG